MDLYTINYIKSNPLVYQYLRANSYWYKELNRNPFVLERVNQEAKKYYKMTVPDKIEKFTQDMEMISTFMDVLK